MKTIMKAFVIVLIVANWSACIYYSVNNERLWISCFNVAIFAFFYGYWAKMLNAMDEGR